MSDHLTAGIHTIDAATYHQDPCERPSLSAHIAATMCARSPLHAWAAHPRLNPDFERIDEQKFDGGTAAHALLLQGEHVCHVVEADDWRTKLAREVRDKAREAGLIPLLAHQWEQVQAMCTAIRSQFDQLDIDPRVFSAGIAESTLIWEDDHGVICRARPDWLRHDRTTIDDLKTTTSARPDEWARRRMFDIGADVQAAFYLRGLHRICGHTAQFRFIVVENTPPYAVSVVSLAPSALDLAADKVQWAIDKWAECLDTGIWPAYATQVVHADAPAYEMERWLTARELEQEAAAA